MSAGGSTFGSRWCTDCWTSECVLIGSADPPKIEINTVCLADLSFAKYTLCILRGYRDYPRCTKR
jgi:hypothetical protein